MEKNFFVYILASRRNGTLYIGVTSNLPKRAWEHRYEQHDNAESAITREKQIKKWNRAWKLSLIEKTNPDWRDLFADITA